MIAPTSLFMKYVYIYLVVRFGSDMLTLFTWSKWSLQKLWGLAHRRIRKDR